MIGTISVFKGEFNILIIHVDNKGNIMIKISANMLFLAFPLIAGSAIAGSGGYDAHGSHGHVGNGRGAYAGIGFGRSEFSVDGNSETYDDTNVRAFLGYDLNRYFAVEGGVGSVPLKDYLNDVGDLTGIDVSILAKLPVTSRMSAYARLGYWDWEYDGSDAGKNHKVDGTDVLYGLGLDYQVSSKFKVRLDATRYEADDADLDTILASIAYTW